MDGTFNNGSLGLYLIAGAIILFVLVQSIFFLVKAWKQGKKLGLDKSKLRNAVTSSALFTIPSALSVLATVIALAPALGLVIPWVRLSVIGNLMYETTAAEAAMEAFGHTGGIANAVTDPTVYAGIAWVMTLGICFSLVILPFVAKPLHKKILQAGKKEEAPKAETTENAPADGKKKKTKIQMKMKFPKPNPREQSVSLSTSLQHPQSLSVLSVLSSPVQSQVRAAPKHPKSLTVQACFQSAHLLLQLSSQSYLRLS